MAASPIIRQLIDALQCLSGVGPKTAQRMAFDLLERQSKKAKHLAETIEKAVRQVRHCSQCHTWSETDICRTCANPDRDHSVLCVIESPSDEFVIEQTGIYTGYYFVLMGHLSPLDGIGPDDIGMKALYQRVSDGTFKEVIIATNHTVEGETTAHYIVELLAPFSLKMTRIAHGIPLGGELDLTDSRTIASAIIDRVELRQT